MKKVRNFLHVSGNMKMYGQRIVAPNKGKGRKIRPRNSNRNNRIEGT